MTRPLRRSPFQWPAALLAALTATTGVTATAQDAPAADAPAAIATDFIRTTSDNEAQTVQLEIAIRKYVPRDGEGPDIWLAGAVHIGDAAYYEALQEHLDGVDLVLYEGVGRPELFSVYPTDDASRVRRTKLGLRAVEELVTQFNHRTGEIPASVVDLQDVLGTEASVASNYLYHAMTDGWGNPVVFAREGDVIALTSLGADATPGGEGADEDIVYRIETIEPAPEGEAGNELSEMQATMARAFGVVFQMNGIDYNRPHFVASDMGVDELQAALAARGIGGDGASLLESLGGPNAAAMGMMQMLAGMIESSPRLQQLAKFMMIELLSQDDIMEMAAAAGPTEGLMEVIIDDRNQVIINDLNALLAAGDAPDKISVFYGVGHFDDLAERMDNQLAYVPSEVVIWLPAMRADLSQLGLSPAMIDRMKDMMRRTMEQAREQAERQRNRANN